MTSSPSWITVSPSAPAEGIIERRAARLAQGAPRESRASHLGNIQTALLRRITPATTIDTGCRLSELLSARPDQLDGKGLRLWKTKNGKPRSVPLSDRAQAILAKRLPWRIRTHQLRYAWNKAKVAMGLS